MEGRSYGQIAALALGALLVVLMVAGTALGAAAALGWLRADAVVALTLAGGCGMLSLPFFGYAS